MSVKPLEVAVRSEPGIAVLDLAGEINSFAEETLVAAFTRAEDTQPKAILLNFTGVEYINSTGIALIVSLLARARKSHRQLIVYGLSDHYQEIFQITRLSDFMSIYPNEQSALASAV